jgi:hypothetical protein
MDPTPDKEDPDVKPPRRGTAAESSEDRKFWGLEDEDEDPPASASPSGPSEEEPADKGLHPLDEDLDPLDEDLGEPDPSPEPVPASDAPRAAERTGLRISRRDGVWMVILAVILLSLAVYAYGLFKSNINTVGSPDDVDFPVKGAQIVIGKIETYWRKPDRGKDHVKLDAHLIPCAEIKLKSGSGASRLRCFFENADGDFVGDPVSLNVEDGEFSSSGSAEEVINATDGFEHEGQYNAYITEQIAFWYLNVFEGPSIDNHDGEFKRLLRMRISPKRR